MGLKWASDKDEISASPLRLDSTANTKQKIMATIENNYDVSQFTSPLMSRARLYAHKLQSNQSLEWDAAPPSDLQRERRNISKQVKKLDRIQVKRFVVRRDDTCELSAFTNASSQMHGVAIVMKELGTSEGNSCWQK